MQALVEGARARYNVLVAENQGEALDFLGEVWSKSARVGKLSWRLVVAVCSLLRLVGVPNDCWFYLPCVTLFTSFLNDQALLLLYKFYCSDLTHFFFLPLVGRVPLGYRQDYALGRKKGPPKIRDLLIRLLLLPPH
jgi:hypothetical protein